MSRPILVIGNKNYSSWSMRAWLLLKWLGVEFEEKVIFLYREESRAETLPYSPTGMLPALVDGGTRVWDSFGIILHMADLYPQVWPKEPARRAFVQSICAEMHSAFTALRSAMPHNGRGRDRHVPMTAELQRDINRIEAIWNEGRRRFATAGPWLAGSFGVADAMFAPVASRFRTYGVELTGEAENYRRAILAHPLVVQWFAEGADEPPVPSGEAGMIHVTEAK
jgi:glutathione S-transferase